MLDDLETAIRIHAGSLRENTRFTDVDDSGPIRALREIAERYADAREAAATDRNLSPRGVEAAQVEAARKAHTAAGKWLEERTAHLQENIDALIGGMTRSPDDTPPDDPAAAVRREFRFAEIRRAAADVDPLLIPELYRSAPAEVRAALRDAPPRITNRDGAIRIDPLVPVETVEEVALAEAEAKSPEKVDEVNDLRALRNVYGALAGDLKGAILDDVPEYKLAADADVEPVEEEVAA